MFATPLRKGWRVEPHAEVRNLNKGNAVKSKPTEHKAKVFAKTDAEERQKARVAWAKTRLEVLDRRLGQDIGATRERARLHSIINPKKK